MVYQRHDDEFKGVILHFSIGINIQKEYVPYIKDCGLDRGTGTSSPQILHMLPYFFWHSRILLKPHLKRNHAGPGR